MKAEAKELTDVSQWPHNIIITEYKITRPLVKLNNEVRTRITNVDKAIAGITDETTDEQVEEIVNESTLLAGVIVDVYVPKSEVEEAKATIKDAKEEVEEVIENEPTPTPAEPTEADKKLKIIIDTCKTKGSISVEELKNMGIKKLGDRIILDNDHTIVRHGDIYKLEDKTPEDKEDEGGSNILGFLGGIALAGLAIFGISRLAKK